MKARFFEQSVFHNWLNCIHCLLSCCLLAWKIPWSHPGTKQKKVFPGAFSLGWLHTVMAEW